MDLSDLLKGATGIALLLAGCTTEKYNIPPPHNYEPKIVTTTATAQIIDDGYRKTLSTCR